MIQYNIYIGGSIYLLMVAAQGVRRKYPLSWFFLAAVLGIYFHLLLANAVFPFHFGDRGVLYWNPDSFTLDFVNGYSSRQIIENLILTFPMSCVLPFLVSIQNRRRFLVTVLLSFSIEWIQLLGCMLGISLHSFDIKDIILNVAGGIAGYGLFWMFCRGMSRLAQIASVSPYRGRGLIPLVLQVVRNCAQGKSSLEGVGLTAGAGRRNLRDNGEGTS